MDENIITNLAAGIIAIIIWAPTLLLCIYFVIYKHLWLVLTNTLFQKQLKNELHIFCQEIDNKNN